MIVCCVLEGESLEGALGVSTYDVIWHSDGVLSSITDLAHLDSFRP